MCHTCVDQMCMYWSCDPEAKYLPSGLNDSEETDPWCFFSVRRQLPLSTSHKRIVVSIEALEKDRELYELNKHVHVFVKALYLLSSTYNLLTTILDKYTTSDKTCVITILINMASK